jgi:hypothetical protein
LDHRAPPLVEHKDDNKLSISWVCTKIRNLTPAAVSTSATGQPGTDGADSEIREKTGTAVPFDLTRDPRLVESPEPLQLRELASASHRKPPVDLLCSTRSTIRERWIFVTRDTAKAP